MEDRMGTSRQSRALSSQLLLKSRLSWLALLILMNAWGAIAEAAITEPKPQVTPQNQAAQNYHSQYAQAVAQSVEITDIRIEATETGADLVITAESGLATPVTTTLGNAVIVEIPDAVLSEDFQAAEPIDGIAFIEAAETTDGQVRIAITGVDAPPAIAMQVTETAVVLSMMPGMTQADNTAEDAIRLDVTGAESRYAVPRASTGTRTDTPLFEVPQSIQVIPRVILEEQQAIRLNDVLRNSPGVIQGNTFGGSRDSFTIRGFEQAAILRDGFRVGTEGFIDGFRETANVEQVEILKGPAAILYGNLEPGGAINLVTEQPQGEFAVEATAQVGSYGLIRPTLDVTGPLNSNGTIRYRLNAAYEHSDGFRGFDTDVNRYFVSPVLAFDIGDRTELTLELEYLNDRRPFDRGIPAIGNEGRIADVDRDTILGGPDDFSEVERLGVGYRLTHHLNENWQLRNRFRYGQGDFLSLRAEPFGSVQPSGDLNRNYISNDSELTTYELQTEVQGEFSTGSINHTLLAAIDVFFADSKTLTTTEAASSINLFDPEIGIASQPDLPLSFTRNDSESSLNRVGILLQDQIELLPGLNILLGGRVDFFHQENDSAPVSIPGFLNSPGQSGEQSETAFTPRVGIVYELVEELAFYASYSQSFQPNTLTETTADGAFLEPEKGEQFELGVKANLLDGRLTANLAYFNTTLTNVAESDPDNPGFVVPVGRQRSRGLELGITGEVLPGWNVLAGASLLDARIEESARFADGNGVRNVPDTSANLWTSYEVQSGSLAGLGFGLGLYFVGERPGDAANTFTLDEYLRTDAAIYYRRDNFRASLNFRNLFDVDYFESSIDRRGAAPGDPFTVIGSVSIRF
ncbi:MAG: TonB-dependent siderophore receptor [Cyanobacteria bacterium P01_F01_bin.153]